MTEADNKPLTRAWVLDRLRVLYEDAKEDSIRLKCLELLLENSPAEERAKKPSVLEQVRKERHGKDQS